MPLKIVSKIEGFRRAGVAHSCMPTLYDDGHFSKEQTAALKAEPMLIVEEVKTDVTSGSGKRFGELKALNRYEQESLAKKLGIGIDSKWKEADIINAIIAAESKKAKG